MPEKVLISGASSGIGEATAYAFAAQSCKLFLVARREARLAQITESCLQKGAPRVIYRAHDLSIRGEGELIVRECLAELHGLDVLVCNAGFGIIGPVQDISSEDMARIWQVNYQSAYESIHQALPHFLQQKRGHIVLVSSIIGKKGFPYSAAYCATKFAQVGLGEALWGELHKTGIGVSVLCPGYTATEFQRAAERKGGVKTLRARTGGQSREIVARALVEAVKHKRREVHLTLSGKLLLLIDRLSPELATRIAAWVAMRQRGGGD